MHVEDAGQLEILHRTRGRALLLGRDGCFYMSRQFAIHRTRDEGRNWEFVTRIPCSLVRRAAQVSRMACRLLRQEVRALNVLADGTLLASNRSHVYFAKPGDATMSRARIEEGGLSLSPPMIISVGPDERVLWGEYDSRPGHGKPVRIYVSDDGGRSYQVARVFEGGHIEHIHNLIFDARLNQYWLLAGDHQEEPGIGLLSRDLKEFEWVAKGKQIYRAVEVFDFGDYLLYVTDTEYETNALYRLEKKSAKFTRLREFEGSCIYACQFGGLYAMTTTVELSSVNRARQASLFLSRDGEEWCEVFQAEKDGWDPIYFQFGSIVLPRGASNSETIHFSGQALKGLDGSVMAARWHHPL